MTLFEVLDVFQNKVITPKFNELIEGVSYDGDPDTLKLEFYYPFEDEEDEYCYFNMILFGNGEVCFSMLDGEKDFIPLEVSTFITQIGLIWEEHIGECRNEQIIQKTSSSKGLPKELAF